MYRYLLIIISFLMMAACADLPVDNSYANDRISSSNSLPSQRPNDQSLIEIVRQLDEIQRQVGQIQGQTEDLAYQSQTTQERQRALYIDLDDRLQDLERSISALNTMNVVNEEEIVFGELPVPGGTDEENYAAAFELLKEQNYELASLAFIRFMTAYPGSSLIDNAQYWLSESYYASKQYEQALLQFTKVINEYPRSRKIPDALLKIGYCNFELGNFSEARLVLMRTQNNYPQSTAAKNAEQRIKIMDDRGI
ncbi:MAG: tol-pal system protein YbgF [Woeseiaceae bacterium]|jgi:tol-pal system protein YbgF|nr:tol-pal system protein YbgF [Woeseiaceae bacterium]